MNIGDSETNARELKVPDIVPDQKLRSLGIFLDVVFALIFFRIVEFLPPFQDGHWVHLSARDFESARKPTKRS